MDKMMESLAGFPELVTTVSRLVTELQSVVLKLQNMECENNQLKAELADVKQKVTSFQDVNHTCTVEAVCREVADRERRSKNIIFYNVPEAVTGTADIDIINEFLALQSAGNIIVQRVIRLGKRPSKQPRPLQVVCGSQHDALLLFAMRRMVPDPWRMAPDRTKAQREILSKVRAELEKRKGCGENNITIKYKNGTPAIVNISGFSKNG